MMLCFFLKNNFITQKQCYDAIQRGGMIENLPQQVVLGIASNRNAWHNCLSTQNDIDFINLLKLNSKLINVMILFKSDDPKEQELIAQCVLGCVGNVKSILNNEEVILSKKSNDISLNNSRRTCVEFYLDMYTLNIYLLLMKANHIRRDGVQFEYSDDVKRAWNCMNRIKNDKKGFTLDNNEKLLVGMLRNTLKRYCDFGLEKSSVGNFEQINREDKKDVLCNEAKLLSLGLLELQINNPSLRFDNYTNVEDIKNIYVGLGGVEVYENIKLNDAHQQFLNDQRSNNLQQNPQQQSLQQQNPQQQDHKDFKR